MYAYTALIQAGLELAETQPAPSASQPVNVATLLVSGAFPDSQTAASGKQDRCRNSDLLKSKGDFLFLFLASAPAVVISWILRLPVSPSFKEPFPSCLPSFPSFSFSSSASLFFLLIQIWTWILLPLSLFVPLVVKPESQWRKISFSHLKSSTGIAGLSVFVCMRLAFAFSESQYLFIYPTQLEQVTRLFVGKTGPGH